MDSRNFDMKSNFQIGDQSVTDSRTFVANVFSWMFFALAITAATAWYFADSGMIKYLYTNSISDTGIRPSMNILGWVVMLAPLGFVIALSAGIQRFSAITMTILFVLFSIIMGMSFSFILLAYTGSSIVLTFVTTSVMFGVMAVAGYTTKSDLTKMGSLLFMALIGIIIAMVINAFMHSAQIDYIISIIGVIIFTGLTAYDVQKIKRIGEQATEADMAKKLTIYGALTLYLDFINLFLFLLRIMGGRK